MQQMKQNKQIGYISDGLEKLTLLSQTKKKKRMIEIDVKLKVLSQNNYLDNNISTITV